MKIEGFIGPAYTLNSVNVDAQSCINLYPEKIESGSGKNGQVAYLKATPGLRELLTVGDGPIRLIHVDYVGRIFVVSGSQLFVISQSGGSWSATLCDTSGTAGTGDPFNFDTSTGSIKAASMSYAGDGSDSSTVFVDGVNNYLYFDDTTDSLGYLDDGEVLQCTYDLTDDIVFSIADQDDRDLLTGGFMTITSYDDTAGNGVTIMLAKTVSQPTNFIWITVGVATDTTFTTAELVEWINTGAVSGRSDITRYTPTNPVYANMYNLSATGGGSTAVRTDLPLSTDDGSQTENLAAAGVAGFGYGIVAGATHIQWIDGYFIVNDGSNKFFISDLKSFNINNLEFASAEGSPDLLLAVIANNRDLWAFGERSIEIYADTGNEAFPFERVQGGFIEIGCAAKFSVAKIDGVVFWLGRSEFGQGTVYMASGLSPQRISTHAIEQAISSYADVSTATAYTYRANGHSFYVINFDEATWAFDLSTGLWHQRAYTNDGSFERHRVGSIAFDPTNSIHIVGDYESNEVYKFDDAYYSDDGDAITRLRSTPHVSADLKRVFCKSFQLDMEVGIGLDGGVQGSSPTLVLDFSDDGGHTWSSESWALADNSMGSIGEYKTRVLWRRLGSFRDRIFRVKMTDPVKANWISAHAEFVKGNS